jgi:hypothetical protein
VIEDAIKCEPQANGDVILSLKVRARNGPEALEQGRNVLPSAQVLESLAQALRLTPNERRHLFLLAGQSLPPYAVEESDGRQLAVYNERGSKCRAR